MDWLKRYWNSFNRNQKRYLVILWILALSIRVIYVFSVDLIPIDKSGIDLDAVEYDYLGWNISEGHGVVDRNGNPNSIRFPSYLYFLGMIYFIFGRSHVVVLLLQALIGTITPILIYFIARHYFAEKVGRFAGILAAIYPPFIWYAGWLMTENLFLPFLTVIIYLTISFKPDSSWRKLIALGVFIGLLSLTRGVGLPLLGVVPLIIFIKQPGGFYIRLKRAGIILLLAIMVLIPYTIRNYIHYDRVMLPSSEGPFILWLSVYAEEVSIDQWYEVDRAFAYADSIGRENASSEEFYRILANDNYFGLMLMQVLFSHLFADETLPRSDDEAHRRLGEKAKKVFKDSPTLLVAKSFIQISRFWHVLDERGRFVNGYAFIIPFFFAGVWLTRKRIIELLPLYSFILVIYGISILFFADARFRMPFESVFIVIAAYGVCKFIERFRNQGWAYTILFGFFMFNYFLRLHSIEVRTTIRTIVGSLGIPMSDL